MLGWFHVKLLTLSSTDNINYAFFASSVHRMSIQHLQNFCMTSFPHKEPSFGNFISATDIDIGNIIDIREASDVIANKLH
jgi:hypothetical protein